MTAFFDRVRVAVASAPGTGAIALGTALTGFRTFAAAGVADQAAVSYAIEDGAAWEVGHGVYTASGPTLTRTTVVASSGSGAINATANATVTLTLLASDLAGLGGRPKLTSLFLNADAPANGGDWRTLSWDGVDVDDVGAYNSSTPTAITVPAGYTRLRLVYYTVFGNVGRNKPNRIDRVRGSNSVTVQFQGITCINESGQVMQTRWMPVQTGDVFTCWYYDDGNAPKGANSFAGPTYVQAEWSAT